jgi:hypothetical protein
MSRFHAAGSYSVQRVRRAVLVRLGGTHASREWQEKGERFRALRSVAALWSKKYGNEH